MRFERLGLAIVLAFSVGRASNSCFLASEDRSVFTACGLESALCCLPVAGAEIHTHQ